MNGTMAEVVAVGCVPGKANVTANSRIQPKTTETKTDVYMPTAADREALARLLGRVCRRVEARDRVLGHQQPGEEDVEARLSTTSCRRPSPSC